MYIPFKIGETVDNDAITKAFKCAPQGGMRRSHETNTLVLVSNHIKKIYDDRQEGDTYLYTGMGMSGDQSLDFAQNKTLTESLKNHIELHFFEVFKSREYLYRGIVKLIDKPFASTQTGEDGKPRLVWIFPLQVTQDSGTEIDESVIEIFELNQKKVANRLSSKDLEEKALKAGSPASSRLTKTTSYIRNQYIAEYTKRSAKGICQLCGSPAPFNDKNGNPFLESHHIVWLSKGGPDSFDNTVALCPNCHKRMHVLNDSNDIIKLKDSKNSS